VPVSSPTNPLGTLWLFADERRDFSSAQTNLLEVIAGRLAADLEREMLLREVELLRADRPRGAAAAESPRVSLPPCPRLEGWDVAGWSAAGDAPGGGWCDWFSVASDQFGMVLGTGSSDSVGSQAETAARMAVRTTAAVNVGPAKLLNRLNAAFYAGDQAAGSVGLIYAMLDTHHGVLRSAQCGPVGLIVAQGGKTRVIDAPEQTLGAVDCLSVQERNFKLAPGDVAILWGGSKAAAMPAELRDRLAAEVSRHFHLPAAQLSARIGTLLCELESAWASLVVRRQKQG
jgi:hypothetical protein